MISLSWPIPACRHVPYLGIRSREIWSETEWSGPKQGALKMGFLKNFSEPFAFALALWPFVSMLLTVPVLALLYHRDNRIRLSSAIVAYGTVLYLLGLLCFTLYPMPADAAAYCAAHHLTPQLNPLQFIGDIRTDGLTAVLQIAFNIVFFLPLGFIMGRIWRWPLPVTAVLSFATSLFLETMQLTGLMGVFPCAYRLFDVDDLLWNTTGALIGFALAMLSLRLIPARVADYDADPPHLAS